MVAILSVPGCGASDCPECSRGLTQICSRGEHYGLGHHGSYAPYVAVHARAAIPLPQGWFFDNFLYQNIRLTVLPGVSPASGAVATDAVMTAYHAVNHIGNVQKDETIVIFGLGGLGFNALQIALAIGSKIYVVDNRPEILEEAIKFGVQRDNAISSAEAFTELVTSKDIVIDTAIDFVGKRETFASAQDTGMYSLKNIFTPFFLIRGLVRYSGNIVLVGLLSSELTLNSLTCIRKQLKILCSYGGRAQDLKECLKLIASGSITPQVETGPLSELPRILDDLHHGKIKSRIALIPDW